MSDKLLLFFARAEQFMERVEAYLLHSLEQPDWGASIAFRYTKQRTGQRVLMPVRHLAGVRLSDLKEVEEQKETIRRNTAQFVKGLPANNVLLTGARGTGKSSLILACLHAYATQGLRLIEVDKSDLVDLPDLIDAVAQRPEKFIIFCDDLSFDSDERGYRVLKSILDGSVAAISPNVLVYATSNRRHLVAEYAHENLEHSFDEARMEIHPGEAVEEKISLSERFGVWVSFYSFNQDSYLTIVAHWLGALGLDAQTITATYSDALRWALARGSRSGRVARQFAQDYAGRLLALRP